jgi:hypothetical protein
MTTRSARRRRPAGSRRVHCAADLDLGGVRLSRGAAAMLDVPRAAAER